jgi:Zn-dependent M28 family amino/carboxypeptidase
VAAVHTLDQVGWDADGDRVFEVELPTPALEARYRAAAELVGVTISITDTTATDHTAFRERGFAAVGLTEEYRGGDTTPHYHRPTDTPDTVDIGYLTLAAQLLFTALVPP